MKKAFYLFVVINVIFFLSGCKIPREVNENESNGNSLEKVGKNVLFEIAQGECGSEKKKGLAKIREAFLSVCSVFYS